MGNNALTTHHADVRRTEMDDKSEIKVDEIMDRLRERARSRRSLRKPVAQTEHATLGSPPERLPRLLPHDYDLEDLRDAVAAVSAGWNQIGAVNPRPPGLGNDLVQLLKRLAQRGMAWYTRPLREFGEWVTRSLNETERACEDAQINLRSLAVSAGRWKQAANARLDIFEVRLGELEKSQRFSLTATHGDIAAQEPAATSQEEFVTELRMLKNQLREIEAALQQCEARMNRAQGQSVEPTA
jgi:hypothetical protein